MVTYSTARYFLSSLCGCEGIVSVKNFRALFSKQPVRLRGAWLFISLQGVLF